MLTSILNFQKCQTPVPVFRNVFSIPVLPTENIIELAILVFAPLVIVELFKLFKLNSFKDE